MALSTIFYVIAGVYAGLELALLAYLAANYEELSPSALLRLVIGSLFFIWLGNRFKSKGRIN